MHTSLFHSFWINLNLWIIVSIFAKLHAQTNIPRNTNFIQETGTKFSDPYSTMIAKWNGREKGRSCLWLASQTLCICIRLATPKQQTACTQFRNQRIQSISDLGAKILRHLYIKLQIKGICKHYFLPPCLHSPTSFLSVP